MHVAHGSMNRGRRAEFVFNAVNCGLAGMSWCGVVSVGTASRCACGGIRSVGRVGLGPANGKVFSLIIYFKVSPIFKMIQTCKILKGYFWSSNNFQTLHDVR
jgi:hypothetical protein